MRRTQICLTEKQHVILTNKAKDIGISLAELLRRIIDSHLESTKIWNVNIVKRNTMVRLLQVDFVTGVVPMDLVLELGVKR